MKSFAICLIKAFLTAAAILLLLMGGIAIAFMLTGVQAPPHFFEEMGGKLGGILFYMLVIVFWLRHQDIRIVSYQDRAVFMDRLNMAIAKMRLKEINRTDTLVTFKIAFSRRRLTVDLSTPGQATLSGMYFPVKTLHGRLTKGVGPISEA